MSSRISVTIKRVLVVGISVVVLALLFWLSLATAYSVPSSLLKTHAAQSRNILQQEGVLWMQNAAHVGGAHYDNYTTYHMLNIAVQSTNNPVVAALASAEYKGADPDDGLAHAIEGESNVAYERYWHGYVTFLRPALVAFDIKQIRLLCQILFFALLAVLIVCSTRKICPWGGAIGVLLALSYMLFGAAQAAETLPLASSFIISVVASLVVIQLFGTGRRFSTGGIWSEGFAVFLTFMAVGAVTVYFDFLDNPILTFCIPATFLFLSLKKSSYRSSLLALVLSALGWCLGYFLLWAAKWVLTDVVVGNGVIESALLQAYYLSGGIDREGVEGGPAQAILANIRPLGFVKPIMLVSLGLALACLVCAVLRFRNTADSKAAIPLMLALFVISLAPYVWYAVLSDHSIMHAGLMTYRDQIGALFPWLVISVLFISALKNRSIETDRSKARTKKNVDDFGSECGNDGYDGRD